jgi:hypothetical protein
MWHFYFFHGEDRHLCFVVDGGSNSPGGPQFLWPQAVPRCGTCGQKITPEDLSEMDSAAVPTYITATDFPIYLPRQSSLANN